MKNFLIILCSLAIFFASCGTNFKKEELYGSWKGTTWSFVFNEDGSCDMTQNGATIKGTYSTFGNAIEFVRDGKVFMTNVSIKSLKGDSLMLDMPQMGASRELLLLREK